MKIGILTFHRAYNYGSMLQAYALQHVLNQSGYDNEIIDFALKKQSTIYGKLPWQSKNIIAVVIKWIYYSRYTKALKIKNELFESFVKGYMTLSDTSYHNNCELKNLQYDIIITGSDQIWNTDCFEFDWAYYCDFPFKGVRLSYAASMGPGKSKSIDRNSERIKESLSKYKKILVREEGTRLNIKQLGIESEVVLDPTLLLNKNEWTKLAGERPIVSGEYILFYSPLYRNDSVAIAVEIGKIMKLPVILTQSYNFKNDINIRHFKKIFNVGPKEFINLCLHSKLIVGSSFHMVAFASILQKQFWVVNGINDNRINQLLTIQKIQNRSISFLDFKQKVINDKPIDFEKSNSLLQPYIKYSLSLLFNSIQGAERDK